MPSECSLTWRTFSQHLQSMFRDLYEEGRHSDITLICEGQVQFRAHKIVLSACSPVFREIIDSNPSQHPLIYLRGIQGQDMKAVLQFMYLGEGRLYQERMVEFLKVAKDLEVKDINIGSKPNIDNNETVSNSENNSYQSTDSKVTDIERQIEVAEDNQEKLNVNENLELEETVIGEDEIDDKEKSNIEADREEEIAAENYDRKDFSQYEATEIRHEVREDGNHELGEDQSKYEVEEGEGRGGDGGEGLKKEPLESKLINIKDLPIDPEYPVCPECGALFTKKSSVLTHYKSKHLGITYRCDQCEHKARDKGNLERHIRSKHGSIKFYCEHCDYQCTEETYLKGHIASRHKNIRYPCLQCDHKSRRKSGLKAHILAKHVGLKYPCDKCSFEFSTKQSLRVHMESVHGGVKYTCDQCGHLSTQASNLKVHMKKKHNM